MKITFKKLMEMRILLIVLTFSLGCLHAQDTLRKFEFGSTLLTVNRFSSNSTVGSGPPNFETANGIFFRYNKKRQALRFIVNYWESRSGYFRKDFRISLGAQTFLGKKNKCLYAFADLGYRNLFITGNYLANNNNVIISESFNGFDSYFGLGLKLKLFSSLIVSPEFACNLTNGKSDNSFTDLNKGLVGGSKIGSANLRPILKLHVTVCF